MMMTSYRAAFRACKLTYKAYYLWKAPYPDIRIFHLHIAKRDLEIARALMNVDYRKRKELMP